MHHLPAFLPFVLLIPSLAQAPRQPVTMEAMWKLDTHFADAAHGVTFLYPGTWTRTEQPLSYHAPALLQAPQVTSAISFAFSEGGFPRARARGPYTRTTLEAVDIVYAAQPVPDAFACQTLAIAVSGSGDDTSKTFRVLHGFRYSVRPTSDAGMSQFISGLLYATYARNTCYLFETDAAGLGAGVDTDVHTLSKHDYHTIDLHLFSIMQTVHIAPPR